MKIKIDQKVCLGCGSCTAIAPETFALDDASGKAKVIAQPKKMTESIQMAINSCPVNAIKVEKEES